MPAITLPNGHERPASTRWWIKRPQAGSTEAAPNANAEGTPPVFHIRVHGRTVHSTAPNSLR